MINISKFITDNITLQQKSKFARDIEANDHKLSNEIAGSSVLVIGGAGSIGSSLSSDTYSPWRKTFSGMEVCDDAKK